jgi:hypothetical protein
MLTFLAILWFFFWIVFFLLIFMKIISVIILNYRRQEIAKTDRVKKISEILNQNQASRVINNSDLLNSNQTSFDLIQSQNKFDSIYSLPSYNALSLINK